MIELRWYTHPDIPFTDSMGLNQVAHGITVLQYRHQVHPDRANAYENGKAYSVWQDVPTVGSGGDHDEGLK